MFDLNLVLNAALTQAIEAATKPLVERIEALENIVAEFSPTMRLHDADRFAGIEVAHGMLADRIEALENNPAIGVDTTLLARVVALENIVAEFSPTMHTTASDERVREIAEEVMDEHCSSYDHDDYDRVSGAVDDFVRKDDLREEICDVIDSATVSIRL